MRVLRTARWLMNHPRFIEGDISTDFIAEEWNTRKKEAAATEAARANSAEHQPSESVRKVRRCTLSSGEWFI